MKIDCSKAANKGDFIVLIVTILMLPGIAVFILLAIKSPFLAGFTAATLLWKWQEWLYRPLDVLIDRHWPSKWK
jgi:hypothetical protein